jgi:hypothetical protein
MSGIMQTIMGGIHSLGSMFGSSGGMGMGGAFQPVPSSMGAPVASALASDPSLRGIDPSMVTGMSAISGDPTGISGPPSFKTIVAQILNDPAASPEAKLFAAQMMKDQSNPWATTAQGLAPLGEKLLEAKLQKRFGDIAPEAHPSPQQPGPFQFTGSKEPASPIATAALIEQLL